MLAVRHRPNRLLLMLAHARRGLLHHYLSFVSVATLAIALTVTLTSGSFEGSSEETLPAAPAVAAIQQKPTVPRGPETAVTTPRVIYYLYDDVSQRRPIERAIRSDANFLQQQNILSDLGTVHFLEVTPESEPILSFLIYEVAPVGPAEGFDVVVVDLR